MKRQFFKQFAFEAPDGKRRSVSSSRFPGIGMSGYVQFRNGGSTTDDDDDDDFEDEKPEAQRLLKKIQKSVRKELQTRATKQEMDQIMEQLKFLKPGENGEGGFPIEALRSLADKDKGAIALITAQGLEIQRVKNLVSQQPEDLSIRSQCKKFVEENKEKIQAIRSGIKNDLPLFEIKLQTRAANSPMLPSNVMPSGTTYITRFEVQPGIVNPLQSEPTFWDYIRKGTTSAETYAWVNKKPKEGKAGFIAPGEYKPAVSFTLETENSKAKKIAVNEKMATELLEDIDGFASWVETELAYALFIEVNEKLMTGVESSTVPAGVQTLSDAYDPLTGVKTANPTFWDCVAACVAQLRVKKFKGQIVCFANSIDVTNAKLTKALNQGQLFIAPPTGATIVEDDNIPLGKIQVIAMDYYKILIYKEFTMRWGWENDDFTHNLVTVIGEMRLHQFHSENHDGFAIFDTIENIKNAINQEQIGQ